MEELSRRIEKSSRKVFRLFFGSRLYRRRGAAGFGESCMGVKLDLNCNGPKRFTLIVEGEAIRGIMGRLMIAESSTEETAYEVLGEMANIIAGNALSSFPGDVSLSSPNRISDCGRDASEVLSFSSGVGRFSIGLEDLAAS